jgi:hypothetical protein
LLLLPGSKAHLILSSKPARTEPHDAEGEATAAAIEVGELKREMDRIDKYGRHDWMSSDEKTF